MRRNSATYVCLLALLSLAFLSANSAAAGPEPPRKPVPDPPRQPVPAGPKLVSQPLPGPALRRIPAQRVPKLSITQSPSDTQTLFYDDFEAAPWPYPGVPWDIESYSVDERYWNDVSYNGFWAEGNPNAIWSAWPAAGGAAGYYPSVDYDVYSNDMETWMTVGPFDLRNAQSAVLYFWQWRELSDNDYLFIGASVNNQNFYGGYLYQQEAGQYYQLDLSNWLGQSQVWVGWEFFSNASGVGRGPYIDDVSVVKTVPTAPSFTTVHVPMANRFPIGTQPDLCDIYEPNDTFDTANGPIGSGQTIVARRCEDDSRDYYFFNAVKNGNVQLTLNLPAALYKDTVLYLRTADGTNIDACYRAGPRVGNPQPIVASCSVPSAGRYIIRVDGKGAPNPGNQYSLRVIHP